MALLYTQAGSGKRTVFTPESLELIFGMPKGTPGLENYWETMYDGMMDQKYKKNTRGFSRMISGTPTSGEPPIYLIPRTRGGPSYKDLELLDMKGNRVHPNSIQYCAVSKGYGMQDVSSFTLGPIVGEGLCLVNAAFSKSIGIHHIEGGGRLNIKRKSFWERGYVASRRYHITRIDPYFMIVNGEVVRVHEWLVNHEAEWYPEWEKWRRTVATCSLGDFHWDDETPTVAYRFEGRYLTFREWKLECYIRPSYELLPSTPTYQFLEELHRVHCVPLGLVHPKAREGRVTPITREFLWDLFHNGDEMCCQPYVVAGKLLGVEL
jgi:hypothetical protein